MAKMSRGLVVVKDNENNTEYSAEMEQYPRKTEAGCYLYLKINHIGIQHLHQNGKVWRNKEDLDKAFCKATGIPLEGLGKLGNWKTPEDKARFTVLIDGNPWVPEAISKAEPQAVETPVAVETPAVVETPQVAAPQPMEIAPIAVPDTTQDPDEADIQKLLGVFGKADNDKIQQALKAERGERATEIWNKAVARHTAQKQAEAAAAVVTPTQPVSNELTF